ncbi:hypothetical protein Dimus_019924 [Dionaea muscipula]
MMCMLLGRELALSVVACCCRGLPCVELTDAAVAIIGCIADAGIWATSAALCISCYRWACWMDRLLEADGLHMMMASLYLHVRLHGLQATIVAA